MVLINYVKLLKIIFLLPLTLVFFGCATTDSQISQYRKLTQESNHQKAAEFSVNKANAGSDLFWSLQAASAYRDLSDYKNSNKWFDLAEKTYKYYNEEGILGGIKFNLTGFILNDKFTDYKGEVYEGVLINTYKALNFLALNDYKNARVEFNRAIDRQRRAKYSFAKEISKKKQALAKNKNLFNTIKNPTVKNQLQQRYSNLDVFKVYPDFLNPYTTYMAGLFYALDNDRAKGLDILKEAYGMTEHQVIAQDFAKLKANNLNGLVWVIFENGQGPSKREFTIHLPLFLVSNSISYAGVSFPELKFGNKAFFNITVKDIGGPVKTQVFASMDAVIVSEFKKDLPFILARSIASAISKTATQVVIKSQLNLVGDIFAIAQDATTGSDTRIWSSLPKEFQLARVTMPKDGKLEVQIGKKTHIINIGKNANNAIVNIKVLSNISQPVINIMRFN